MMHPVVRPAVGSEKNSPKVDPKDGSKLKQQFVTDRNLVIRYNPLWQYIQYTYILHN